MMRRDALVLHCAYMQREGKAILFSAPGGTGKTTQATLWEKHRGTRVVNGDKALIRRVDGYAAVRYTYDARQNLIRKDYLNGEDQAAFHTDGYASEEYTYDALGRQRTVCYLDVNGAPTVCRDGYAGVNTVYDRLGRLTQTGYVDVNGEPFYRLSGYAAVIYTYDSYGNVVLEQYADATGACVDTLEGYAQRRMRYDRLGRVTMQTYLNAAGGHLAASLCGLWRRAELWRELGLAPEDVRPNAAVLCYPVICADEDAHRGSFVHLSGAEDVAAHQRYSVLDWVSGDYPPTFLWHTFTDESVPVRNSLRMALRWRTRACSPRCTSIRRAATA